MRKENNNSRGRCRHGRRFPIRPAVLTWAVGSVAVLAAVIAILATWVPNAGILPDPMQAQMDIIPDSRARNGTLHAMEEHTVEKGDFWVVINQILKVELGKETRDLEYKNPEVSHYSARVNLYLTGTGEHLGGIRWVDPGSCAKDVTLNKKLETGNYPVTTQIELSQEKMPTGSIPLDIISRMSKEGNRIG